MIYIVKFSLFIVICTYLIRANQFDWKTANTTVWLSSGAYCPTETYLDRTYLGYSTGFVPTNVIADEVSDTAGFIGYMKDHASIYITLRGSVSFQNWIDDFDAIQVPFNNSKCQECFVHEGFNYAWKQVEVKVLNDVKKLRQQFPDYSIVVTGHSLGGALASLCAIALQEAFDAEASVSNKFSLRATQKLHIIPRIRLFTFGAPRFSNAALATYTSQLLLDRNRITHYKDMAPHCPPYMQYTHISGEWYENEAGLVGSCSGFEDPTCADQWYYTSIADHMHYLTLPLGCSSVSAGEIRSVAGFREPEELGRQERVADKVPVKVFQVAQQTKKARVAADRGSTAVAVEA